MVIQNKSVLVSSVVNLHRVDSTHNVLGFIVRAGLSVWSLHVLPVGAGCPLRVLQIPPAVQRNTLELFNVICPSVVCVVCQCLPLRVNEVNLQKQIQF